MTVQDKIEDLQSKLTAVQEQRAQLRSRSHMLATALQLRKEELRKLRERQAQVLLRFKQHLPAQGYTSAPLLKGWLSGSEKSPIECGGASWWVSEMFLEAQRSGLHHAAWPRSQCLSTVPVAILVSKPHIEQRLLLYAGGVAG